LIFDIATFEFLRYRIHKISFLLTRNFSLISISNISTGHVRARRTH
jgi:hypothetical protein